MKKMKKLLALLMTMLLVLCLCACNQSAQGENTTESTGDIVDTKDNSGSAEKDTQTDIPDGMVQYKVKVVDEKGNPVVGAMIQVCTDETCLIPVKTDDTGVATFPPAAEGAYHANFLPGIPAGYEADAEVFYFADGETELTIQLRTVAG